MRRSLGIFLAAVLSSGALTSCSSNTARSTPTIKTTPTATATAIVRSSNIEFFFAGDSPTGFKLFSEHHAIMGSGDIVTLALNSLISGDTQPFDSDYTNLWGDGTSLIAFKKKGNLGSIDLKMGKLSVGAEAESRAIDQLLWTASKIDSEITEIELLVDGKKVESIAGHVDTSKPIKLEKSYEVLSPLQISSLPDGASEANPISISGEGCTFEANLVWTLRKSGKVVNSSSTTAKTACPDRSAWSVELAALDPGAYSFTVEDFSAKDGSLVAKDDKNFKVT